MPDCQARQSLHDISLLEKQAPLSTAESSMASPVSGSYKTDSVYFSTAFTLSLWSWMFTMSRHYPTWRKSNLETFTVLGTCADLKLEAALPKKESGSRRDKPEHELQRPR